MLSPFAIEDALSSHPSVAACVAFAVPHAELGETVGLMAVVAAGQTPVRLETLRTFALTQGKLGARALPSVLVWSTRSGLPTGRTGKPLRIGLAARLGLTQMNLVDQDAGADGCTVCVGGDSGCQCWIAHKRCDQSNGEDEWQLEPWRASQHESGSTGPASNGVVTAAEVPTTINELIARANAALRSYAVTISTTQPEKERVLDVVAESIRRLAVMAIGLEPGATSDDIITADGVLMDRGLDSMSATAFVDDICTMFRESSWASVPEETDRQTVSLTPSGSETSTGSAGIALWTTETLRQHETPRKIAMALCDLAATSRMSRAAAAANDNSPPSEVCSSVDTSVVNVAQVKAYVDESQRKLARAKSVARREAKRAPRLSKAERRAAFGAQKSGNSRGGTTASASQNVARVENASLPGDGLHYAKHGDLATLREMVEERGWDASAARDRHGLTALQWAAGAGHLEVVEYLLHHSSGENGTAFLPQKALP